VEEGGRGDAVPSRIVHGALRSWVGARTAAAGRVPTVTITSNEDEVSGETSAQRQAHGRGRKSDRKSSGNANGIRNRNRDRNRTRDRDKNRKQNRVHGVKLGWRGGQPSPGRGWLGRWGDRCLLPCWEAGKVRPVRAHRPRILPPRHRPATPAPPHLHWASQPREHPQRRRVPRQDPRGHMHPFHRARPLPRYIAIARSQSRLLLSPLFVALARWSRLSSVPSPSRTWRGPLSVLNT